MRWTLSLLVVMASGVSLCAGAAAAPDAAGGAKPREFQQRLARTCEEWVGSAVKRPYGWAWGDSELVPQSKQEAARPQPVGVSMEPGATPAVGLILLDAAELLGEPKYAEAARHVGRGVAAAQQGRGNLPSWATFGPSSATTRPVASPLPDRAPTRAGLALLLALIDADPKAQDAVSRATPRAAQWLMRQQSETGGWPVLHPPGAAPADATRIVRLDTPDTRDSVLAMLLAYEVLGDVAYRRSAERSLEFLNKVRAGAAVEPGAGLWQSAYTPSAQPVDKFADLPAGFDALASRYNVQTLLASWAVLGDTDRLAACEMAVGSLEALMKNADGEWHRRFDAKGQAIGVRPSTPFPTAEEVRNPPAPPDAALPGVVRTVAAGRAIGREKFRDRVGGAPGVKRQLAWTMAGLSDEPMLADFPAEAGEVEPYLKQHAERLRLLEGGEAASLSDKIRQFRALYLRAQVEKEFGR